MKTKRRLSLKLVSVTLAFIMLTLMSVGCSKKDVDADTANQNESPYTHRVILVSDMHYTVNDTESYKELYPNALLSEASGETFGFTQEEKLEAIATDIDDFAKQYPLDAVMVLGDLSLDDYGYRNLANSYLKEFKEKFMKKLSYPSYALAGNHDSYPELEWKRIMGTDRQYSVKIGDAAFIMLDTFEPTTATGASGSKYVGIDTQWLKREIEKYPTEMIFLCTHFYQTGSADYELTKLMKENERIVCMFRGHSHENATLVPEELDYRFLFDIGGYAYQAEQTAAGYDFTNFDPAWAWGYQVLEWNDTEARLYHVKTARQYNASNGVFDFVGGIEDETFIEIKK